MGGTGWEHFVPYQPNLAKALQELREEIFRAGQYEYSLSHVLPKIAKWDDEGIAFFQKSLAEVRDKISTIDGLLEVVGESGTSSILDVKGITAIPRTEMVFVLPDWVLQRVFGTGKPTRLMIEKQGDELFRYCLGWSGICVVVYKDGLPDEIYFYGNSGD